MLRFSLLLTQQEADEHRQGVIRLNSWVIGDIALVKNETYHFMSGITDAIDRTKEKQAMSLTNATSKPDIMSVYWNMQCQVR